MIVDPCRVSVKDKGENGKGMKNALGEVNRCVVDNNFGNKNMITSICRWPEHVNSRIVKKVRAS